MASPRVDAAGPHALEVDSEMRGDDMALGRSLEKRLRDAGFINVQSEKFVVPLGTWPRDKHYKRIDAFNLLQMEFGLEGIALASLTRGGPVEIWRPEEVQVLLAKARKDLRDPKINGLYDFYSAYGQKPG